MEALGAIIAAGVTAAARYSAALELADRAGWRGNRPADAAEFDAMVAKLDRGRSAAKYAGAANIERVFGRAGTASKVARDVTRMGEILRVAVPPRDLMYSTTGVALGPKYYSELAAAESAAADAASAVLGHIRVYQPDVELQISAAAIEAAMEEYMKYVAGGSGELVIAAYMRILHRGLELPELVRPILAELETVKTAVLETEYAGGKHNRHGGLQTLLQTYNLRPLNQEIYTVAEAFAQIGAGGRGTKTAAPDDARRLAEAVCKLRPDVGIYILHRESMHPITYKIPDAMPKNVGPSASWIARTSTITVTDCTTATCSGKYKIPRDGIEYVGKPSASTLHVLDIVGPNMMRWLSPYGDYAKLNTTGGHAQHSGRPYLPRSVAHEITNAKHRAEGGAQAPHETAAAAPATTAAPWPRAAAPNIGALPSSERIHGYYALLAPAILEYLDDPLISEPGRVDEAHWRNMRNLIADNTMRLVTGRADPIKVARIATREAQQIMQVDMIGVNATLARRRQYLDEISVSVEANLRQMEDKLGTLLKSPVTRAGLLEALERVVTAKSNLFKAMDAKNAVLSVTLLRSGHYAA